MRFETIKNDNEICTWIYVPDSLQKITDILLFKTLMGGALVLNGRSARPALTNPGCLQGLKDHPIFFPQLLQNFSPGLTGFPQALQIRFPAAGTDRAGSAGWGGGDWCAGAAAVAGVSGTFTRHLLQNLSPGLRGFPHALQTSPVAEVVGATAGAGTCSSTAARATAGARISGTFTRHLLQNLSPGVSGFPHALQTIRPAAGAATGTAACGGGGGRACT